MIDDEFNEKAALLNVMANAQRLRMLTTMLEGEISVGTLAQKVGLSQSALSQHLAKLRAADIVRTRRDAQTVFYSVKSDSVSVVLATLDEIFGAKEMNQRIAS
jgi:ArsR family transcriptional regulator, virulence genes transcriptional regulator